MMRTILARVTMCVVLLLPLAVASASPVGVPQSQVDLFGIEEDTGYLYHITAPAGNLSLTLVADTGVTGLASLEFAEESLFGFTHGSDPLLYEFAFDGSIVDVTSLDLGFAVEGGLALGSDGTAYAMNASIFSFQPKLFTLDLETGAVSNQQLLDTAVGGGALDINGLAWLPTLDKLLGLDRSSNSLITIDPSNGETAFYAGIPTSVGRLGGMAVDPTGQVLFNTSGPVGQNPGDAGSNLLYRFDPITKTFDVIGSFASTAGPTLNGGPTINGSGISGLAIVPEPATLSLLMLGGLTLLRRRRG